MSFFVILISTIKRSGGLKTISKEGSWVNVLFNSKEFFFSSY